MARKWFGLDDGHLGWRGTLAGPAFGALILIVAQDLLQGWTEHWTALLGVFIMAVVLFMPHGIVGGFLQRRARGASSS